MRLVERESHLRTAAAYLGEAAAGHGRLLFVAGEAGVGKTTFVHSVAENAAGDVPGRGVSARLVAALRTPPTPGPYLLVVEDAHWADEATVDLLRHLARRAHTTRALVLVTSRPGDPPAGHALRVLMGEAATAAGVRRLDVAPLTPAGLRSLVLEA